MGLRTITQIALRLLQNLLLLLGVAAAGIILVLLLTIAQSRDDQARRADVIVIAHLDTSAAPHFDAAVRLYQQGYASRLIVAGGDPPALKDQLIARRISSEIILIPPITTTTRLASVRQVAAIAQANRFETVLIVEQPDQLLLTLKLAGDYGLDAYGVPISSLQPDLASLLQSALDYWQYALLGSTRAMPAAAPPPRPPPPPPTN
ncbi:MAG: YdcF family protein [Chloroflexaceae bacterium]|nr:YdcF family protein [Chloroflexaceae bacterium]